MTTTTMQFSSTKRFGTMIAGALIAGSLSLAVAAPSYARPKAPAKCGPAAKLGNVTINGCAIDECVRKGGLLAVEGLHAFCCVTTGIGEGDPITVCEEIAQNIDMIVVSPTVPPAQPWSPRPFGSPSRFGTR